MACHAELNVPIEFLGQRQPRHKIRKRGRQKKRNQVAVNISKATPGQWVNLREGEGRWRGLKECRLSEIVEMASKKVSGSQSRGEGRIKDEDYDASSGRYF